VGLRELLYRATANAPSQAALRWLARAISVPNLAPATRAPRHPFLVAVTIDTEGGYVESDERRRWQGELPDAFQGYVEGVRNVRRVLDDAGVRATFLVSTHGLGAPDAVRGEIVAELSRARDAGHEIGLHLHPTSDRALRRRVGASVAVEGGGFDDAAKIRLVRAATAMIDEAIGVTPVSFRWGNWGLDAGGVRALEACAFLVDSSAIPGCGDTRRPRDPRFDWRRARSHAPWRLDRRDHQSTIGDGSVVEIPIATCRWHGRYWRADPLFAPLLDAMLAHYYEHAPRDRAPFPFVLMTHSSEATTRDGHATRALRDLASFVRAAKRYADVEFVTLREARSLLDAAAEHGPATSAR
jgi:peptidoglycan/xylan/chitin deacetylase (PgdA/CDA1 family)